MSETKSLAEFIRETREKAGFSVVGLSKKSGLSVEEIEDIESGKELFLPATVRQKLAKGLKVNPIDIKHLERTIIVPYDRISSEFIDGVKKAILEGETENLRCPLCGSVLITKVVRLLDLENNITLQPKAHCKKCSFQVK